MYTKNNYRKLNIHGLWFVIFALIMLVNCAYLNGETVSPTPPIPPPEPSPLPTYTITAMETVGNVEGELARFKTNIALSTFTDGWQSVRLFTNDASITNYRINKGKTKDIVLQCKKDAYYFLIGKKGDYEITIEHISRIRQEKLGQATIVYFIPAVKSSVRFSIPVKNAKVSVQPEINYGILTEKTNITEVLLFNTLKDSVTLSWSTVEIAKISAAKYFVEQQNILSVSKGSLRIDAFLDYSILQGEVDSFEVNLAGDLNIISVSGDNIRKWDSYDAQGQKLLKVNTEKGITKSFVLHLVLEKILEAVPMTFVIPEIIPLAAEREKGYIAVVSRKDLRIEPASLNNISQIDLQDMPPNIRTELLSLAFKYLKRPFHLSLKVDNVQPKVFAETITTARCSKDSFRMDTNIVYTIRDAGVYHFNLAIDPGLRVINIEGQNINNWYLKNNILTIDLRSKAEGTYNLTLLTEKTVKEKEELILPTIQSLDVEREQGYLGLIAFSGLKIDITSFEGLSQMNVKEFPISQEKTGAKRGARSQYTGQQETPDQNQPEQMQTISVSYPDFAFRYIKHPYTLKFSLSDIKSEISAEVRALMKIDERKVNLSYTISYDIRKAGLFNLKINLPKELRIVELNGLDIDDWKRSGDELNVTLSHRIEKAYSLNIETEVLLEKLEKEFIVPALQLLEVKKEQGYLAIKSDPALRINTDIKSLNRMVEIDIKELPQVMAQFSPTLAYKYFETPWTLKLNIEKVKPTVMAETFQLISIGEAVVHSSITVRYQVLYAAIGQFKVVLPKDAMNIDIRGDNIKHKGEEVTDEGRVWTISLHAPVLNIYNLYISFQSEMKKDTAGKFEPLAYRGIKVLDVERETGYLTFAARPDMELAPPEIEFLTAIDEREIPQDYKVGIDIPILLSYRYLKHPYKLTLKISQNEFSKVLVATIDAAKLASTIGENGQIITDLTCQIRNTKEQYLRIAFPTTEIDIWHVRVAGRNVSCFTAVEKGQPVTLVPIAQESKTDTPFQVNIRYATKMKELSASGMLNLKCPQVNIPIMRLGWTVSLPEKYELIRIGGTMEPVWGFEAGISSLDAAEKQAQTVQTSIAPQQAVQQGQIDQQSLSNFMALENIKGAGGGVRGVGAPSLYTGQRPATGNTYNFQTLISLDLPVEINAHYVKQSFGNTIFGFCLLLVLLFSLWFIFKTDFTQLKKITSIIASVLVLIGLHTLLPHFYEGLFNMAIWTLVLVIIGVSFFWAIKEHLHGKCEKDNKVQPPEEPKPVAIA